MCENLIIPGPGRIWEEYNKSEDANKLDELITTFEDTKKEVHEILKEVENNLILKNITHKFEELVKLLDDEIRIISSYEKEFLEKKTRVIKEYNTSEDAKNLDELITTFEDTKNMK